MRRSAALAAALALAAPTGASAHLVGVEFGDFYAGALHVATGPEHVAALLAIALLAALQGEPVGRWALVAAPAPMLAMAALAALGAAQAAGARLGAAAFAALVTAAALAHGWSNGLAAGEGAVDRRLFALGVGAAGLAATALGAAAATVGLATLPRLAVAYRVIGSWIAAVGLAMTGLAVAQAAG